MSRHWNYNSGTFYVTHSGNAITYLEINPCGCCPNSVLKVAKFANQRRYTKTTIYFENIEKELKKYLKDIGAIALK